MSNSAADFILSAWSSTFLFILSTVFDTAPCIFFTKFGFLNFVLSLGNLSLDAKPNAGNFKKEPSITCDLSCGLMVGKL